MTPLEKYSRPDMVNLGASNEVRVKELVDSLMKLTRYNGRIIWDTSMPDGPPRRRLDASKAIKEFRFEATTDLKEGLKKTIKWYAKT